MTLRADTRQASITLDAETLTEVERDDRPLWSRSRGGALVARLDSGEPPKALLIEEHETGRELFRVPGSGLHNSLVSFSPDETRLAVYLPDDQGLAIYRCPDGSLMGQRADLGGIGDLCFHSDGARIGLAMNSGDAFVVDAFDGRTLASLRGHTSSVRGIDFSPDGGRIATASSDGTVRIWGAASGAPISAMQGLKTPIYSAAFTLDGAAVITAAASVGLQWWDASSTADPFVLQTPGTVYGIGFSPDGSLLAAACLGGDKPLRIWDARTWRERFAGLDGYLSALAFDRDGKRLAVGRSLRFEPTSIIALDGTVLTTLRGSDWRTDWVGFNHAGDRLFSLGNDGRLKSFDIASRKATQSVSLPPTVRGEGCRAVLSPDGRMLAFARKSDLRLIDAASLETVATLAGHTDYIYALAFSPDGARLVSGSRDRTLRVWDVGDRTTISVLTGHNEDIFAAVFSPDGKRIISGGRDRVIRVWDAEWYEEITQLHGHTSFVYCLAFSPDGRTLASGGGDATVRIWDIRPYRDWRAQPMEKAAEQAMPQSD
jgi:WD40 repeat protein